jgi:hypothetical protein
VRGDVGCSGQEQGRGRDCSATQPSHSRGLHVMARPPSCRGPRSRVRRQRSASHRRHYRDLDPHLRRLVLHAPPASILMTVDPDWGGLQKGIAGDVVLPGSPDYDAVRKPFAAQFHGVPAGPSFVNHVSMPKDSTSSRLGCARCRGATVPCAVSLPAHLHVRQGEAHADPCSDRGRDHDDLTVAAEEGAATRDPERVLPVGPGG